MILPARLMIIHLTHMDLPKRKFLMKAFITSQFSNCPLIWMLHSRKNLQVLVTEILKVKRNLAPDIMKDVFELKEPSYNLRSESNHFTCRNVKTAYYDLLSIEYLAPQIWEFVPKSMRKCKTLNESKSKIKSWCPDYYPRRLCTTYIARLGFI